MIYTESVRYSLNRAGGGGKGGSIGKVAVHQRRLPSQHLEQLAYCHARGEACIYAYVCVCVCVCRDIYIYLSIYLSIYTYIVW
jgi:hypothetical protein